MRTITPAAAALLAVTLCCHYLVEGESTIDSVERVMKSCKDKYNIQNSGYCLTQYLAELASDAQYWSCGYLESAIKNKKLPQDGKGKAFLMCIIREVGFNKLKNIIRGGAQLNGEVAKLIALPDVERELLESSPQFGIL